MSDLPRHGSPADRGSADSYYNRPRSPHYFEGATYRSRKFEKHEMTRAQIEEYYKAYDINEASGDKKDWGCE